MNIYNFEMAYRYEIWRGYVKANSLEEAKEKILNEEWDDIIDTFDIDECAEEYEIIDIW